MEGKRVLKEGLKRGTGNRSAGEKGVQGHSTRFLAVFFFVMAFLAKPVPFDLQVAEQEDNHEGGPDNPEISEIRPVGMIARPADYAHYHKIN